jgi:hypothetical protein
MFFSLAISMSLLIFSPSSAILMLIFAAILHDLTEINLPLYEWLLHLNQLKECILSPLVSQGLV